MSALSRASPRQPIKPRHLAQPHHLRASWRLLNLIQPPIQHTTGSPIPRVWPFFGSLAHEYADQPILIADGERRSSRMIIQGGVRTEGVR